MTHHLRHLLIFRTVLAVLGMMLTTGCLKSKSNAPAPATTCTPQEVAARLPKCAAYIPTTQTTPQTPLGNCSAADVSASKQGCDARPTTPPAASGDIVVTTFSYEILENFDLPGNAKFQERKQSNPKTLLATTNLDTPATWKIRLRAHPDTPFRSVMEAPALAALAMGQRGVTQPEDHSWMFRDFYFTQDGQTELRFKLMSLKNCTLVHDQTTCNDPNFMSSQAGIVSSLSVPITVVNLTQ